MITIRENKVRGFEQFFFIPNYALRGGWIRCNNKRLCGVGGVSFPVFKQKFLVLAMGPSCRFLVPGIRFGCL